MSIDVTEASFNQDVIEQSKTTPVLVDFWAEWCGPCRMLGPVLEKVEADQGAFILAKIDTDSNQNISGQYKISGIPAVKLFINGEVAGEFTGALPEPMVIQFLEKHLPNDDVIALLDLAESDPIAAAEQALAQGKTSGKVIDIFWQACLSSISSKQDKNVIESYLQHIPSTDYTHSDTANSLRQFYKTSNTLSALLCEIIKNINSEDSVSQSLDLLLEQVAASNGKEQEAPKQEILLAFQLIGTNTPLVNEYRKKLSRTLY